MSACGAGSGEPPVLTSCPPYPVAGPAVAAELSTLDETKFPAFIEWMQRLDKLAEQLEVQNDR